MSYRSELERVLNGGTDGVTPWYGDLSYYYFSLGKRGILRDEHKGPQGEARFYRELGVGMYMYAPDVYSVAWDEGYGMKVENDADGGVTTVYHTPGGRLTSHQKYLPETFSHAYTKHCVQTVEELLMMAELFEHMRYAPSYDAFAEFDAMIGDGGMAVALTPISAAPVQKLLARWAGVENTIAIYLDYPDEFEECVSRIEAAQEPVFDIIAGAPARVVEFPENLSSEITGHLMGEFNTPYYRRLNEKLHAAGKQTAIHIDGTLRPCLSQLAQAGFDIAEAVTPAPVGDIDAGGLRAAAGDDIIIWGGIPGALFTPQFTDAEFERHVGGLLSLRDPKFVLGVADQVPPDGIWERVKSVRGMLY